jgi:ABC-type nitrate/sulfonate/bicarbonate transport system substrate-binding protein
MLTRRRLILTIGSASVLGPVLSSVASAQPSPANSKVRMTTGLTAATHGMGWIGMEAGVFRRLGLDVSYPRQEVGGPESVAGMARGEWEFTHTGTVPVAENVLRGGDAVILLRNHDAGIPGGGGYVMTRREIADLRGLAGKKVGVLTDAYSGQAGVNARQTLEKAGASATYVGLGRFGNIYYALARGEIDAGILPLHLRIQGQHQYGWHAFNTAPIAVPSVFATMRRVIGANRPVVLAAVRGIVETMHLFKTRPDVVVPILQRYLGLEDAAVAEEVRAFYAPHLPAVPRPALGAGVEEIRRLFASRYPAAARLQEKDIVDASIIDEVEKNGFIARVKRG